MFEDAVAFSIDLGFNSGSSQCGGIDNSIIDSGNRLSLAVSVEMLIYVDE